MAVGFPTKVNYATGDVLTATNMNDLSGTVNLLQGTQNAAGKNLVINSAFDFWQRSTSATMSAGTWSNSSVAADRWKAATYSASLAGTFSRQSVSDTTNLPNLQYCGRVQRNAGNTVANKLVIQSVFETVNSIPYAGKIVTFSFYARAGATFSSASNALAVYVWSGTGTDQSDGSSFTNASGLISQTATLTTTWQRFTYTGTVTAATTQLGVWFEYTASGTAGATDYFEVTGVQLEAASNASAFARNGGTYQAELAACQRYLPAFTLGGEYYGYAYGVNTYVVGMPFTVNARVAPTGITTSGTFSLYDATNTSRSATVTFGAGSANMSGSVLVAATGAAGAAGRLSFSSSALILFTGCEL
jgi:hypothetical protein